MKLEIPDAIRMRFLDRCRDDLEKLRQFRATSAGLADGEIDENLVRIVHGLAGTGGTLGFAEISRQAGELESLLIESSSAEAERRRALDTLIETLAALTGKS